MLFPYFVFFLSFFFMVLYNVHYLFLLLLLEFILLSVFIFLVYGHFFSFGLPGLFLFLLLIVCMGCFSVSLLVGISRFLGRDFWVSRFIF